MTLPAHRFRARAEERKKDGKDKPKVWTFDYDETVTKAPDECARMSQAFKALDDKVYVVTGNPSPRKDLLKNLDDWGFKYDDLIQYQDDNTDGLNRAAVLKQLDTFCAFDDRAGRGYTFAKVCPHFFLIAKPPKNAKKGVDGKKDTDKIIKDQRSEGDPLGGLEGE